MSDSQRNSPLTVLVDRHDLAAVREQSLLTLEANHHYFEEVEAFGGEARQALARIYREAFDVLDAIGWDAPAAGEGGAADAGADDERVPVPLTPGHVEQLRARRFELGHANIDRVEHTSDWTIADLEPNRQKAWALDRLFGAWAARVAARETGAAVG
ncbi:hypothetical protein [Baekduia sp. Peel2402]|uniref:hypothetical protein n=1 Tax=Baekduia sp. Peel2402 TaxID=3458296 RepID=UPI00403EE1A3